MYIMSNQLNIYNYGRKENCEGRPQGGITFMES